MILTGREVEDPAAANAALESRFVGTASRVLEGVTAGASALAQFANENPTLASLTVIAAQAAITGGPVKQVVTEVAKAAIGDALFGDARSKAFDYIQAGVSEFFKANVSGIADPIADLLGAGAAFGVDFVVGGATDALGGANRVAQVRNIAIAQAGSSLARAGLRGEERVSSLLKLPRNVGEGRVTVPGTGKGQYRIPDFNPVATIKQRGSIVEVKDLGAGQTLTSSNQLRDLQAYANSRGVPLEIFTNAQVAQTGQLAQAIQQGLVKITPIP